MADAIRVGMFAPMDLLDEGAAVAAPYLDRVADAGIDHVCCGDHVSFAGAGFDGIVQATALAMLHPTLPVYTGVYLLPLRHPVVVARQLADFASAGSRAPRVRGRRRRRGPPRGVNLRRRPGDARPADERMPRGAARVAVRCRGHRARRVLRSRRRGHRARAGAADSHHRRRAVRRGGPAGRRVRRRLAGHLELAAALRRGHRRRSRPRQRAPVGPIRRRVTGCRCGAGSRTSREAARACLAPAMQAFYRLPFERFERYCPYGTAEDVAEFLAPTSMPGAPNST